MSRAKRSRRIAMLSPLAFALAFGAYAQSPDYRTPDHTIAVPASTTISDAADAAPSTDAFLAARQQMLQSAPPELTGNVDYDFVTLMIPEHRSAIAMAQIVRDYGEDPELRARAKAAIDREQAELDWMIDWLERNGQP